MSEIKIHIFHIGKVCVAPELPFGGEHYSALKASGVLDRKSKRLWLPVSAYLIECAHGNVLFDCGWHRDMSPHGVFERGAQIRSLSSLPLYSTNQVVVETGRGREENSRFEGRTALRGERLTRQPHQLQCGLVARHEDADLRLEWPYGLCGPVLRRVRRRDAHDGQHSGPFQGPVRAQDHGGRAGGCTDGGYAKKSWEQMLLSGIADDRAAQKKSLAWIRAQSRERNCVACIANHDFDVKPGAITL